MRPKNNKERATLVKKLKDLFPVSNFTLRENAFMLAYED